MREQTTTLPCTDCGNTFEISTLSLAMRRAAGWNDEDAQCLECRRRWERAWDEYMQEREGHHARTTV